MDAIIPGIPREIATTIQDWEHDLYGLTIILVMLFMPRGIAGGMRSLWQRVAHRTEAGGESS